MTVRLWLGVALALIASFSGPRSEAESKRPHRTLHRGKIDGFAFSIELPPGLKVQASEDEVTYSNDRGFHLLVAREDGPKRFEDFRTELRWATSGYAHAEHRVERLRDGFIITLEDGFSEGEQYKVWVWRNQRSAGWVCYAYLDGKSPRALIDVAEAACLSMRPGATAVRR